MRLTKLWRDLYRYVNTSSPSTSILVYISVSYGNTVLRPINIALLCLNTAANEEPLYSSTLLASSAAWFSKDSKSWFYFPLIDKEDAQLKKVMFSCTVKAVELAWAFAVECSTDQPDVEQTAGSIHCKDKTRLHRIWFVCSSCEFCETRSSNKSRTCFPGRVLALDWG